MHRYRRGRPHIWANVVSLLSLEKMDEKLKSENMQKSSFLCLIVYVIFLRAIRAGRCIERRYADHILIQIYFRMHHFVVKFSKFSSPHAARRHCHIVAIAADIQETTQDRTVCSQLSRQLAAATSDTCFFFFFPHRSHVSFTLFFL